MIVARCDERLDARAARACQARPAPAQIGAMNEQLLQSDRRPRRRTRRADRRPDPLSDRQPAGRGLYALRRISRRAAAAARLRGRIRARRRHARRQRPLPAHQRGRPLRRPHARRRPCISTRISTWSRPATAGRVDPFAGIVARRQGLWPRRLRHEGRARRLDHRGRGLHGRLSRISPARSRFRARSTRNPAASAASPISPARAISRSRASTTSSSPSR